MSPGRTRAWTTILLQVEVPLVAKKVWRAPKARAASCCAFLIGPCGSSRESRPPEVAEVSELLKRCDDNNMVRRREALRELCSKDHPDVSSFLIKQTGRTGDSERRLEALRAMSGRGAARCGFPLTFAGPETLDPDGRLGDWAARNGVRLTVERDPDKAVEGADMVVTDTWVSMHDAQTARERRHNQLRPYQVNERLMAHARPDALFMHCLPAHRGEEATSAVMDS